MKKGNACMMKEKNITGSWKSILKSLLGYGTLAAATLVLFTQILLVANVDGNSMNDTYQNGDCLLCRRFGSFEKGDVIICTTDEGKTLIKRIIGTSGDTIDIDFELGIVKVNGKALDEPYIKEITHLDEGAFEYPITVPENCYFVLGDNRNHSSDSRKYGYIKEENIKGKVFCEIPFI